MVDLAPILAEARVLVEENGREVTFIAHDTTLNDAAQPWEGPTDARAVPSSTATMDALFFNPGERDRLGKTFVSEDLVNRSQQIMMVLPIAGVNVEDFQEVLDEGTYWKITGIEVFKPGSVVALAYVGVSR